MFKDLDPILHSQLRLQIVSLLMQIEYGSFNYLLEVTGATKGNISTQINKLKAADYIMVTKEFKDNYPLTTCRITQKGKMAFEEYVKALKSYIEPK